MASGTNYSIKIIDLWSGFEKTWKIIDFVIEKDGFSTVKHILVKSHNSCFTHPPEAILSPAQGKRTSTFQFAIILALPRENAQVRINV